MLIGPESMWSDNNGNAGISLTNRLDLQTGQFIVVTDGVTTKTIVLEGLTFDTFDLETGHFAGTAPEPYGRLIVVEIGWENGGWSTAVNSQQDGSWEAVLNEPVPEDYQWAVARVFDDDWDISEVRPTIPAQRLWSQVNLSGFGDPGTRGVTALAEFNGALYAGASNWNEGGSIWRWGSGSFWTPVSGPGFGYGNLNPAVVDLFVYNEHLYAGVGWDGAAGKILRSVDGENWEVVLVDGFGNAANNSITAFAEYAGYLYAAAGNDSGLQVWRSLTGEETTWEPVVEDGFGYSTNRNVTGFIEFNGALYAAVESATVDGIPAYSMQVWRTFDGTDWESVTEDGFGDAGNTSAGGFAVFNNQLYLGTRNDAFGAQLWSSEDGTSWSVVITDGFGDSNNIKIESLLVMDGCLYAATYNYATGTEVFRSEDGETWIQLNEDGFRDSGNFATLWNHATIVYQGALMIATWNDSNGGEVWRMADP